MNRLLLASAAAVFFATTSFAQSPPPNISRWSGSTALVQPQGFTQGSPLTLTWGFMSPGAAINGDGSFPDGTNNLQARMDAIYGAGTQATIWQPLFQSTFDRWSSISGLSYVFEPFDDGAAATNGNIGISGTRADVRIGGKNLDGNSGVLAYNWFPNRADMVIDTNDSFFTNTASTSLRLRNVVAHEHGHGLGMDHVDPSVGKTLMEPFVSTAYNGPQFHDILVAQRGYGDALEKTNAGLGNDIVTRATALGAVAPGSPASIGNSPRVNMANNNNVVAFTATDFISIDSSTDTDFFSFSVASAGNVSVLLEALGITYDARPQGQSTAFNFNTRNRIDMALRLWSTDGTTLLQFADLNGFGGDELINFLLPAAGTYFVSINGIENGDAVALDTQFYGLTVSFSASIPEPATVALMGIVGVGITGTWWNRRRKQQLQLNSKI